MNHAWFVMLKIDTREEWSQHSVLLNCFVELIDEQFDVFPMADIREHQRPATLIFFG
jgi:hypothetical protein